MRVLYLPEPYHAKARIVPLPERRRMWSVTGAVFAVRVPTLNLCRFNCDTL